MDLRLPESPKYASAVEINLLPTHQRKQLFKKLKRYKKLVALARRKAGMSRRIKKKK